MEQLKRFEADPDGYSPTGAPQEQPLYLDVALASEFLTHSRDVDKNSVRWVKKQQGYLAWWADQFKGRNLRKLILLDDILPALEGQKARGHRIAIIKRVYSYLRKVKHVLTVAEDPTFGRLSVPQAKPEQWKRVKAIPLGALPPRPRAPGRAVARRPGHPRRHRLARQRASTVRRRWPHGALPATGRCRGCGWPARVSLAQERRGTPHGRFGRGGGCGATAA
ncbi:hypothetical protein POL68_37330 [Stigmatella sp. ncwal1]|uniref:Uncharacterized protein n=1 Tax=Stigmatella ashevillensis TaxID=2995309 RepID=A0ABT5DKL1_9BACT|nr:hypothetical protein [Stigmatella ashevillena]MDC0714187.1 hypothetical protein [Stigmatella ashevillena]